MAGEVIPGDGYLRAEVGELQEQDEEADGKTKAPGPHAPGPIVGAAVSQRRHQAEGDTGEDHLQHPHNAHRRHQRPKVQGNHDDRNLVVTFVCGFCQTKRFCLPWVS